MPTLILHRRDYAIIPFVQGRYLAEHIAGARLQELPGADGNVFWETPSVTLDASEEFLTGVRGGGDPQRILATVLFTDIVASTERAAELGDRRWREILDVHDDISRREVERSRGRLIKTTGDGIFATFDGPGRAIQCASAIALAVRGLGIEIRAGVHTGEVEMRGEDVGGIAVHIGARVMDRAGPGEILVSRTVRDLIAGSDLILEDRGIHALKDVEGAWQLFGVSHAGAALGA